jgi:hypothetical protein
MRANAAATPTTTTAIPSRLTAESTPVSTPSDVVVEVVGRIRVDLFDDDTEDVVNEVVVIRGVVVEEEGDDIEVLVVVELTLVVVLVVVVLFVIWTWGGFKVEIPGLWDTLRATGDRQQRPTSSADNPLKSR